MKFSISVLPSMFTVPWIGVPDEGTVIATPVESALWAATQEA
jgi:hypothetical protein